MASMKKLPPRRRAFAQAYLLDPNGTQAAIKAGFAARSAYSTATRLLRNAEVAAAIAEGQAKAAARTELTVEKIVRQIACLALSDVRDAFDENGRVKPPHEWPDHVAAAVSSIEAVTKLDADGKPETTYKIKLWNKGQAIEQAAKRLGLWIERHLQEHTGKDGGPIEVGLSVEGQALLGQALAGLVVGEERPRSRPMARPARSTVDDLRAPQVFDDVGAGRKPS